MIEVTVNRYTDGTIKGFQMSGHANSGPYGHDLVCAAASAVSFGAVNAVISLCDIEPLIDQRDDGGFLDVTLPTDLADDVRQRAQLLLDGMVVSLETIERDYGQYIHISTS
ncbi:uncharacterized protein YsxB (DUF464 family) [Alkalibacillus flavidus]|uniref:Ribosomal processing cysteine protease Prp n=1 Tax=Alkalibacillus flavidus TaxID=546021 RepID=A0ABV2KSI5_9BACI